MAAHLETDGVSEASFLSYFENKAGSETSRFPTDAELGTAILMRPQYNWILQNRLRLILEEREFAAHNRFNINGALQEGLSIGHIMPRSWMAFWPLQSGALAPAEPVTSVDADMRAEIDRRNAVLDTLLNLTLLTPPANSQVGNCDFANKKTRLMDSLLKTNVAIASEPDWHEAAMQRRAVELTILATSLWPLPDHEAVSKAKIAEQHVSSAQH